MGARGPNKDEKEVNGWSLICQRISTLSGQKPGRLEAIFQVGDGTGNLFRKWRNGDRLARFETRQKVIAEAQKRGWIGAMRGEVTMEVAAGATAPALHLQPHIPFPLPDLETLGAGPIWALINSASANLVSDVFKPTSKAAQRRQKSGDWRKAVIGVRAQMEIELARLRETIPDKDQAWRQAGYVVQAHLAAAYKMRYDCEC